MLNLLERLINEHGSSTIIREHLLLVKAEYEALERKHDDLQAKKEAQDVELQQLRLKVDAQQSELDALKGKFAKYACDHCGSPDLVRVGNRPDPIFGDMGAKEMVFRCRVCAKESAFTP